MTETKMVIIISLKSTKVASNRILASAFTSFFYFGDKNYNQRCTDK